MKRTRTTSLTVLESLIHSLNVTSLLLLVHSSVNVSHVIRGTTPLMDDGPRISPPCLFPSLPPSDLRPYPRLVVVSSRTYSWFLSEPEELSVVPAGTSGTP